MKKHLYFVAIPFLVFSFFCFCGCGSSKRQVLAANESQVKLRSMQSRLFDTTDKIKTLRTAMATLQDLGFVIDKADDVIGSISATKLDHYSVRITVSVRQHGDTQMLVRANAQYNLKAIEDPEPYQQFFDAFAKAMFLTAHHVGAEVAPGATVAAFDDQENRKEEEAKVATLAEAQGQEGSSKAETEVGVVARPEESTAHPENEIIPCANCGEQIGKLQLRFDYQGKTVCMGCYAKLVGQK